MSYPSESPLWTSVAPTPPWHLVPGDDTALRFQVGAGVGIEPSLADLDLHVLVTRIVDFLGVEQWFDPVAGTVAMEHLKPLPATHDAGWHGTLVALVDEEHAASSTG